MFLARASTKILKTKKRGYEGREKKASVRLAFATNSVSRCRRLNYHGRYGTTFAVDRVQFVAKLTRLAGGGTLALIIVVCSSNILLSDFF